MLETGHRTTDNAVGPIYYGEPVARVWKTLGKTTPSRRCDFSKGCRALRYTDGRNLLILEYDESNPVVGWIRVFAHAWSRDAVTLPAAVSPLSAWRWRGARILRLPAPRSISGWTTGGDAAHRSFSYGHACATAFEHAPGPPRFAFFCE